MSQFYGQFGPLANTLGTGSLGQILSNGSSAIATNRIINPGDTSSLVNNFGPLPSTLPQFITTVPTNAGLAPTLQQFGLPGVKTVGQTLPPSNVVVPGVSTLVPTTTGSTVTAPLTITTTSTTSPVAPVTPPVRKNCGGLGWLLLLLCIIILGFLVWLLVWLWNKKKCKSNADCAYLCKDAKYPCQYACDKGACVSHATTCLGANEIYCPTTGKCINTLIETCPPSNGGVVINNGLGNAANAAATAGAIGAGTGIAGLGSSLGGFANGTNTNTSAANNLSAQNSSATSWLMNNISMDGNVNNGTKNHLNQVISGAFQQSQRSGIPMKHNFESYIQGLVASGVLNATLGNYLISHWRQYMSSGASSGDWNVGLPFVRSSGFEDQTLQGVVSPHLAGSCNLPSPVTRGTSEWIEGFFSQGLHWKSLSDGETWTRKDGKTYKLDTSGNLLYKDTQGNWWKKGTYDLWWLDDRDGSVLKKDGLSNMWKQDIKGQVWKKTGKDANWNSVQPNTVNMNMAGDTQQAQSIISRMQGNGSVINPTQFCHQSSTSSLSSIQPSSVIDVYGNHFLLKEPFSIDNGYLPSMIQPVEEQRSIMSNISAQSSDSAVGSTKRFYPF